MLVCSTRRLSARCFSSTSLRCHENPLVCLIAAAHTLPDVGRAFLEAARLLRCLEERVPFKKELFLTRSASSRSRAGKAALERAQYLVLLVPSQRLPVNACYLQVNLAFALSSLRPSNSTARLKVGVLDLDIFGPSIPTLMGLQHSEEPLMTAGMSHFTDYVGCTLLHVFTGGALIPLINHGIPVMSMGFLLPRSPDTNSTNDTPVVWRGLMVQKAVQQLLFDVDWKDAQGLGLDVLVIDMPPGTGDVPLTLGQLVIVDGSFVLCILCVDYIDVLLGAVIVSTPQDVALADVSKGIAMLRKVAVPVGFFASDRVRSMLICTCKQITGIVLNQSHFMCPECEARHYLYGPPEAFRATAARLGVDVLGELPLVPGVSQGGDAGLPYGLLPSTQYGDQDSVGGKQWLTEMRQVAEKVWLSMQ
jgi:ATP-binding protein involved in chromosome partitioning